MKLTSTVSVVIVCMNKPNNLVPCLNSIIQYTHINYEIWVNAYMFSPENLNKVQMLFPCVHWVVNNKISGFSENNNLVLKQVNTEYVLILNDDTIFKEPVLDKLLISLKETKEASIMSPKFVNGDDSFQSCGRPPIKWYNFLLEDTFSINNDKYPSKYTNKNGIFKSFNVTGACFLIRTDYFRSLGFFDEYYFFTPEDIALSTKINELGGNCYVDSNVTVHHLCGGTRKSKIKQATLPAQRMGCVHFHGRNSNLISSILKVNIFVFSFIKTIIFALSGNSIESKAQWHCVQTIFTSKSPKEIFTEFYLKL